MTQNHHSTPFTLSHERWKLGHYGYKFLEVRGQPSPPPSGIRVEYDLSREPGQRVRSLRMLCTGCRVPRYEAVEEEALYRVVLPSYLVTGGDGFSMIRDETLKHDSGESAA